MRVRFYGYGILILGLTALLASCKAPTSSPSKAWVVSTLAGSGTAGSKNGTGAAAQFDHPRGVAVDSGGNVYVADLNNRRIRKITPGGEVSTLAGSNTRGFADAPGTAARFQTPSGVAVDSDGNVYVGDLHNHRIRKITAEGVVSTLAGSGTEGGYKDGPGAKAKFRDPYGVAVDSEGNVYVADSGNQRIRKITAGGVVTTLAGTAGDEDGTEAQFNNPYSVAVDSAGNVYVADTGNHRIRKITPGGVVTTLAGSGTEGGYKDGTGAAAQFSYPRGVAVDSEGNVYVADSGNHRIRKMEYKVP